MKKHKILIAITLAVLATTGLTACRGMDNSKEKLQKNSQGEATMDQLIISGGSEYLYAPKAGNKPTYSAPFTVSVNGAAATLTTTLPIQEQTDKTGQDEVSRVVYVSIESSSPGAAISEDGIVSIDESFLYGDINGADVVLRATLYTEGVAGVSKSFSIHVRQPEEVTSFEIDFPEVVTNADTSAFRIHHIINQYNEPYSAEYSTSIKTSDKNIQISGSEVTSKVKLIRSLPAAFSVTIDTVTVEKRFLICEAGYTPTEDELISLREGASPIEEPPKLYFKAKELDTDCYLYLASVHGGVLSSNSKYASHASLLDDVFTMDVSYMAEYQEGALYQVCIVRENGQLESCDVSAVNGKISLPVSGAAQIEVTPVFRFIFGKQRKAIPSTDIQVLATQEYDGISRYGFYDGADNAQGYVHLKSAMSCFVFDLPDGYYNVDLTKGGTGRSLVAVNGQALGCNVGIGGKGDRRGILPYTYYMEDVAISGSNLRISLGEKDTDLAAVEIRRSTTLRERRRHIYIGGDSTAANYYPIELSEPAAGRYQTGWGQVFEQYVTDDVCVTNLGSGGTYAKSWYEIAFQGVLQNARPGDCFIIMEGINDQSYSNVDEMYQYLAKMVEECREREIIPVLCTSMQTPKFWRSATGKDLSEFECPEGGGKAAFMKTIRTLAKDKGVFLIDVGLETSRMYGIIGRTYVAQNYHIYNPATKVEEDTLHLSYAGAMNVAGIIATGLYRLQETCAVDGFGASLSGFSFQSPGQCDITYTGKDGRPAVYSYESILPVYKPYAIRTTK